MQRIGLSKSSAADYYKKELFLNPDSGATILVSFISAGIAGLMLPSISADVLTWVSLGESFLKSGFTIRASVTVNCAILNLL